MEQEWITAAASGNAEAFSRLVERYGPQVFAYFAGVTGEGEASASLTEQTFLRAWHGISLYRGDPSFDQWLLHIASGVLEEQKRKDNSGIVGDVPVPDKLTESVMAGIYREKLEKSPLNLLKRFRFTLAALIIAAILLLLSGRISAGKQAGKTSPGPEPSVSQEAVVPDTAFLPGADS